MSSPSPSPAEGFFDFFLVRFDLGFGSAMGGCGGTVAAGFGGSGGKQGGGGGARAGLGEDEGLLSEKVLWAGCARVR
jgi:hypothetical protein